MKKWTLFFVFTALFGILSQGLLFADDTAPPPAPQVIDTASPKLDEIAKKQDEILQKLDDIMKELEVVKIRASSR